MGRTGKDSSHAVPFFPILSHFSHLRADDVPELKLKGRIPDVVGLKIQFPVPFCPILSRWVREAVKGLPEWSPVSAETKEHSASRVLRTSVRIRAKLGKGQLSSVIQIRCTCNRSAAVSTKRCRRSGRARWGWPRSPGRWRCIRRLGWGFSPATPCRRRSPPVAGSPRWSRPRRS